MSHPYNIMFVYNPNTAIMRLLDLKSDFVFRAVFTRSPNSLIHLINAVLNFSRDRQIKEITILPSENPKETPMDKLSILDIKAINNRRELINIEMQVFPQSNYLERALFYWARLFTSQLREGDPYDKLKNTYSINFLDFGYFKERSHYKSHFVITEKNEPSLMLTGLFQMVFIELPKFGKELKKIDDILEPWLYLIKNAESLDDVAIKILVGKNPAMKETIDILEQVSIDPELLSAEEARRKALRDYNSNIKAARVEGKAEGVAEGEARGEAKGKAEIAKKLLARGHKVSEISEITGLSQEELQKLI